MKKAVGILAALAAAVIAVIGIGKVKERKRFRRL